jgi:hypothetical protein
VVVVDKKNVLGLRLRAAGGSSGDGRRFFLAPQAWLQIAFSGTRTAATATQQLARQFNIDTRTVRRAIALAAEVFLNRQAQLCSAIAQHPRDLAWAIWSPALDAASRAIALGSPTGSRDGRSSNRSATRPSDRFLVPTRTG